MKFRLLALLFALALAGAPAAAYAASAHTSDTGAVTRLIQDCLHNGKITGHYSQQTYSTALAHLPTDVAEYSDCADVIRRAQLAAAGGQAAPGGGSVSNPRADPLLGASAAVRAAVAQARTQGRAPLDIGGTLVRPGVVPVRVASITQRLPTSLLIVLAALLSIALFAGGQRAVHIVRSRRSR